MDARFVTRLYALGSNGCGQLGVGHCEDLSEPQPCLFQAQNSESLADQDTPSDARLPNERIVDVVAGGNHTLILTDAGRVYAAGNGDDGKCGSDSVNRRSTGFVPLQRGEGTSVIAIAATWEASFFVDSARKVWSIGRGSKGELGLGPSSLDTQVPREVLDISQCKGPDSDAEISSISAGMSHVVVLLSNGSVYGWGSCRKGQLGEDVKILKTSWQPHKIDVSFSVRSIALGREYSFLEGESGQNLFLGDPKHFGDGFGLTVSETAQTLSTWSSIIRVEDGRFHGFGRNDRGQLPPTDVALVTKVAVGSEHGLAYTAQNLVVAWGWGEHGNCGLPVDEQGNVAGRVNNIHLDLKQQERVVGLGAGCATSFIWTRETI